MKVAYVHIPKTGGGSIKHWWMTYVAAQHDLLTWYHEDLAGVLAQTEHIPDTSFTVVRNTWRRLISAYQYGRHKALKKLRKRGKDTGAQTTLDMYDKGIIPFLEWMREQDHHNVRCQARYSEGVEHVIRDHSLREWQAFTALLGIQTQPARTHRVLDYDPAAHMHPQFVEWVKIHYRDEIDRFAFEPETV